MTPTRRELLRLGGFGAVAAILPEQGSPEVPERPQETTPLPERTLQRGLDVLCTAHATDAFERGHAGGALITAYYLCREEALEPGTTGVIQGALDAHYGQAPARFPDEEPAPEAIPELLRSMEEGLDELCRGGHDIIFLSLALRAFHDLPRTATPARIAGLRRTLRALAPRSTGRGSLAVPEAAPAFAEFVLTEFLASTEGVAEQGFAGHVLTNGRALLDLRALGHEAFARKCLNAFQLFLAEARPQARARDYREERPRREFLRPDAKEYWVRRAAAGTMELGHLFKYPYAFYGLRRQSENARLNEVCLANSFRLFRT